MSPGSLYIVSTPIGNLEDITLRAIRILKEADFIAAEDTRHTQNLLLRFDIHKTLTSYHDHNKEHKAEVIIERILEGQSVALVTDAGTPGISDPGYYLINVAIEKGVPVVPIPGATAAIAALSISGLPTDAFAFEGFLPSRHSQRLAKLDSLKDERRTLILYEAPHRLLKALVDIRETLGERRISLSRELTKVHEETLRGNISDIIKKIEPGSKGAGGESRGAVKGEITLIIGGSAGDIPAAPEEDPAAMVDRLMREKGLSRKAASAEVATATGRSRKEVYDASLKIS